MRIGVIGSANSYYARELTESALRLNGVEVATIDYRSLMVNTIDGKLSCYDDFDGFIARTIPPGSLEHVIFRMDCLITLETMGRPVINPSRTLETAVDKWLTLVRLSQSSIPVPNTIACQSREKAMQAFINLGRSVVVKPLFGGEGRGIVRIDSEEIAWRVFGAIENTDGVIYVQELLPHFGYDIRILFVGDEAFAIKRFAQNGWLTNIAQGGRAEVHHTTEEELQLAKSAITAVGGSVLGVDLLPTKDKGLVVLEVNAVPGWKATAQAHRIDISGKVLQHAVDRTRQTKEIS